MKILFFLQLVVLFLECIISKGYFHLGMKNRIFASKGSTVFDRY